MKPVNFRLYFLLMAGIVLILQISYYAFRDAGYLCINDNITKKNNELKFLFEDEAVSKIQEERQKILKQGCLKFRDHLPQKKFSILFSEVKKSTTGMIIDDRLRYIWCRVGKVSSTSWKRTLLMWTGRMRVNRTEDFDPERRLSHKAWFSDRYLDRARHYDEDEFRQRIETYFNFFFVRHPLERLASAYREYFGPRAKRLYGRLDEFNNTRVHFGDQSIPYESTFAEFVEAVVNPKIKLSNDHWQPYSEHCYPCQIHYEFVGKFETLLADADYLTRKLGGGAEFPRRDPMYDLAEKNKSREVFNEMMATISPKNIKRLNKLYAIDNELFDYNSYTI